MWKTTHELSTLSARLDALDRLVGTATDRLVALETSHKAVIEQSAVMTEMADKYRVIDAEWSMWFDKFRNMLAKLAKRDKADAQSTNGQPVITNPRALALLQRR